MPTISRCTVIITLPMVLSPRHHLEASHWPIVLVNACYETLMRAIMSQPQQRNPILPCCYRPSLLASCNPS